MLPAFASLYGFTCSDFHRAAVSLYNSGSKAQAVELMEEYARTKCKPFPYTELEEWYSRKGVAWDAKDALERGVTEREPALVVKRVRWVCEHINTTTRFERDRDRGPREIVRVC
jgi:hypothetical protein